MLISALPSWTLETPISRLASSSFAQVVLMEGLLQLLPNLPTCILRPTKLPVLLGHNGAALLSSLPPGHPQQLPLKLPGRTGQEDYPT